MNRRRLLAAAGAAALGGCAPMLVQRPLDPQAGLREPRLGGDHFVSFDGARLGLTSWMPQSEPWAVIAGLHGMNDYANAYHLAAAAWAEQGIATYAIDQRGFGRSPERGVWAGETLMVEDARVFVEAVRARHPGALLVVAGESMGGAVSLCLFGGPNPPAADRLVLLGPAVWGWSSQPLPFKTALWITANLLGSKVIEPPRFVTDRVMPTDNIDELRAMGRDKLMVWGARSDTLYGMVDLMQSAWEAAANVKVPTLWCYGAHDEVIPKNATFGAVARLRPGQRTAYYAEGYHLLMRDHQRSNVYQDVVAFLRDPSTPPPSGAPPIPHSPRLPQSRSAGL